mgnify:CR=1 FL=1
MVKDFAAPVKTALYQLLSGKLSYSGKVVPVYNTLAGVNAGTMWVTVEDYSQRPDGTKVRPMYQSTVLIEVVVKGDDYTALNSISEQILATLYPTYNSTVTVSGGIVYILDEPTMSEFVDDNGSDVYLRRQLRVGLRLSPSNN